MTLEFIELMTEPIIKTQYTHRSIGKAIGIHSIYWSVGQTVTNYTLVSLVYLECRVVDDCKNQDIMLRIH